MNRAEWKLLEEKRGKYEAEKSRIISELNFPKGNEWTDEHRLILANNLSTESLNHILADSRRDWIPQFIECVKNELAERAILEEL